MATKVAFPITTYNLASGSPVAFGTVEIRLNIDGQVKNSQVKSNPVIVSLDINGEITGSPVFWKNSDISPPGTYYVFAVYSTTGERLTAYSRINF